MPNCPAASEGRRPTPILAAPPPKGYFCRMRLIWLIFVVLAAAVLVSGWLYQRPVAPLARPASPAALPLVAVASRQPASPRPLVLADSLVRFALSQLGTRYCYAGSSPTTGFDCSGFVRYVFGRFAVPMPHSTALLIGVGRPVARARAQPGDIVVFTGTAAGSTVPGHAGIVISALGEAPLRFVHASSAKRESGVKVSQVEGSGYEQRFMQVRRVL
jgi:cell wall-associated NlpC family hydrolase